MFGASPAHVLSVAIDSSGGAEGARVWQRATTSVANDGQRMAGVVDAIDGRLGGLLSTFRGMSPVALGATVAIAAVTAGVTAAVAAADKAIQKFGEFQQTMANVKAASGATADEIERLSDAAIEISQNSKFAPTEAAEALYALAGAGLSANQQIKTLPTTLGLAAAAQGSLEQATELVLGSMSAFGIQAAESARISDVFTASINVSSFNIDRLSVAMRNAGPASSSMGQSFEGTVAALSVLVKVFNNGDLAGTGLKSALGAITSKSKELGLEIKDSSGKMKALPDLLDELQRKGIGAGNAIEIFGNEAGPALAILLSAGSKGLREMEKSVQANGQALEAAGIQMDTYEGDQAKLANSIEAFWIRLGGAIVNGKRSLTQSLTDQVQALTEWVQAHAEQIGAFYETITGAAEAIVSGIAAVARFFAEHGSTIEAALWGLAAGFIAVKAAAAWGGIVTFTANLIQMTAAVGVQITALSIYSGWLATLTAGWNSLTAAMLSNPIGIVAAAIGLLVFWLVKCYNEEKKFQALQEERKKTVQSYGGYLEELRGKVELLTEAEAEHGRQMLNNLEIEAKAARAAAERMKAEDPEAKRSRAAQSWLFPNLPQDQNVPFTKETQAAVKYAEQLENMIPQLREQLATLGGLSDETITVIASASDGLGEIDATLQKAIASFKRAAADAEALVRARVKGIQEYDREKDAIERRNAALDAGAKLGSAAANEIMRDVARRQAAEKALDDIEARDAEKQRNLRAVAEAHIALEDAINKNTAASVRFKAATEAEDEILRRRLQTDGDEANAIRARSEARAKEIAGIDSRTESIKFQIEFEAEAARATAELADARDMTAEATRALAVEEQIAARMRAQNVQAGSDEERKIRAEEKARRALIDSMRAQAVAARALNERQRERSRADAELQDWKQREAAVKKYGQEVAGILDQYGLLSDATRELYLQEASLAQLRDEELSATTEDGFLRLLQIQSEIQAQQEYMAQLGKIRAEHDLVARAMEPIEDAWTDIVASLKEKLVDFVATGKASWRDLAESAKRQMIAAVIEWMIRSITAHKAVQAEAIKTAAITAAASNASGGVGGVGGNGGGGGGGVGTYAGYASTAYKGYSWFMGSTSMGKAMLGNPMTGGNSFMGGAGSGFMTAAIFAVVAAIIINQIKTSGRSHAKTQIDFGGNSGMAIGTPAGGSWNGNGGGHNSMQTLAGAQEIINQVTQFIEGMGGQIDKMGEASHLLLGKIGQGSKSQWYVEYANGLSKNFGKDMEAALEFAMIQAIKQAPTSGLPKEVEEAVKGSTAETMDQLSQEIAKAFDAVRLRLGTVGAKVFDTFRSFQQEIAAAEKLGRSTDELVKARDAELAAIKDSLVGINASGSDRLKDLISYQAGVQELTSNLTDTVTSALGMTTAEAEKFLAQYQGLLEQYHFEREPGGRPGQGGEASTGKWVDAMGNAADEATAKILSQIGPMRAALKKYADELGMLPEQLSDKEIGMAIFETLYQYLQGSQKYEGQRLEYARMKTDLEMQAVKAQIIALGMWDKYSQMWTDAYAAAMATGGAPAGRMGGGGSGKGNDRDQLRDMLKDAKWQEHIRGMSDFARQMAEINKKWDEAKELAHGNKKLLDEIAEARRKEIEALREQAKLAHNETLRPYLEDKGKSGPQLEFEKIRREFAELRKNAKELGEPLWKVNQAERERLRILGQDTLNSLNLPSRNIRNEIQGVADTINFLRENMAALGISAEELAAAEAELQQQRFMSLAEGLAQYIDDEDVKANLAQMRYEMEIANYRLEFELLKEKGLLTKEQQDYIQGLFDKVPDKVPGNTGGGGGGGGVNYYEQQQAALEALQESRKKIFDAIAEWEDLGTEGNPAGELKKLSDRLRDLQQQARAARFTAAEMERLQAAYQHAVGNFWDEALAEWEDNARTNVFAQFEAMNQQFVDLIAAAQLYGGDIARIQAAQAVAAERFWRDVLQPLKDYRDSLALSDLSPLTPAQRFAEAMQRFNEVSQAALAGDVDAINALPGVIDALLQEASAMFASGPEFQAIFAMVQAVLDQVLAIAGGVFGPTPPAPLAAAAAGRAVSLPAPIAAPLTAASAQSFSAPVLSGAPDRGNEDIELLRQLVVEVRNLGGSVGEVRAAIELASGGEVAKLDELIDAIEKRRDERVRQGALSSDMKLGTSKR